MRCYTNALTPRSILLIIPGKICEKALNSRHIYMQPFNNGIKAADFFFMTPLNFANSLSHTLLKADPCTV